MTRELNKIFGTNRKGARKILDKFDISKEDKNKVLNNLKSSSGATGEGGGNDGAFTYKSRKVVWKVVDEDKFFSNDLMSDLISVMFPIYSIVIRNTDNKTVSKNYGYMASAAMVDYITNSDYKELLGFEEADGFSPMVSGDLFFNTNNGLVGMLIGMAEHSGQSLSEEEVIAILKNNIGLEKVSYEEYINAVIDYDNKYANF